MTFPRRLWQLLGEISPIHILIAVDRKQEEMRDENTIVDFITGKFGWSSRLR